jgi:4a-hydroxytetrahydrobiopterin dehydratase
MLASRCLRSLARCSLFRPACSSVSSIRHFSDVPRSPDSGEPLTRELIDKVRALLFDPCSNPCRRFGGSDVWNESCLYIQLVDEHLLTPNYHRSLKSDPFAPIAPMPVKALTDAEKKAMLTFLPDWLEVANRNAIFRSFQFADFKSAFHFMTRVSIFAESVGHHPEWFNVYNRLEITLTTHDASGVSMRDITMAAYLDRLFQTPIDAVENLSRWRATDKLFAAEDTLLNLRPELAIPQMVRHAPVALMPDDQVLYISFFLFAVFCLIYKSCFKYLLFFFFF